MHGGTACGGVDGFVGSHLRALRRRRGDAPVGRVDGLLIVDD